MKYKCKKIVEPNQGHFERWQGHWSQPTPVGEVLWFCFIFVGLLGLVSRLL